MTITLCCIVKDELKNLPILLESVKGCFDKICLVDTGSTDGTLELIKSYEAGNNPAETPIELRHFVWVDDFSAARNFSFSNHDTDYLMWLDADDSLFNREGFLEWKRDALYLADVWVANYDYAHDEKGNPACTFARERCVKNHRGLTWKYFVHEGIDFKGHQVQFARTWKVSHRRDAEDLKKDRSRNLLLFSKHKNLDARMRYYYGKELFENHRPMDAFTELMAAANDPQIPLHDKVLALQFAAHSAFACNQFDKCIEVCHQGMQLAPRRAEFLVTIADAYLKKERHIDAIPFFEAALSCKPFPDSQMAGPIYETKMVYGSYPLKQLARIWYHIGDVDKAIDFATRAQLLEDDKECQELLTHLLSLKEKVSIKKSKKVNEIVITCPPQADFYEWDEGIEKERGVGGSEIAAIRMAKHLSDLTGYKVRVFNKKEGRAKDFGNVSYEETGKASNYFSQNKPLAHIAWRHATPLTDAPMFVWCHDLGIDGLDRGHYEKVLALSPFHKTFLKNICGVEDSKILVTRNGIDADRFVQKNFKKQFGKIVWPSSPDRGLERAISVLDSVVKDYPQTELHVFYGFDNMEKRGMWEVVRKYQALFATRPWIKYRGNLPQSQLHDELRTSTVWFYPTNFLETFCITALETQLCGVFGLVRDYGALPNTLSSFDSGAVDFKNGRSSSRFNVLKRDCETEEDRLIWGEALAKAITVGGIDGVDPASFDWKEVAREWIGFLPL